MSLLVLAIGNLQREDDGVAWAIAAPLIGRQGLDVRRVMQLGPELAPDVSRADTVLFVDARHGGPPGAVRLSRLQPTPDRLGLTHALSPRALLFYAGQLYGRAPRAHLLTVTGERFGHGEGLSESVWEAVAALTKPR